MRPNAVQAPVRLSPRYQQCQNVALTEDRCVEGQNSGAGQEISSLSSMISALLRCCGTRVRGCIGVRRVRRLRELVGVCRQRLPRCSRALRTVRDVLGVHERSKFWSVVISLPCAFRVGGHEELSHPLCIDCSGPTQAATALAPLLKNGRGFLLRVRIGTFTVLFPCV